MSPDRFQRVKQLVQRALDLPEAERTAFLERECAGDRELRAEVEGLLAQPTEGLDDAAADVATLSVWDSEGDVGAGRPIGPYRLLEKIGEGGMGEVWVAEQTEPVKRRVALKVIKRGMDSDKIVARFEAERQALALMDHPSIAKVFDGGQTPGGRPYFVMEYVDGVPITEHCDRHKLSTRERLELFSKVCEAVQHAHQKAVIHRDLKPSNVLVTIQDDRAAPKIIDFGVAKATSQRLTEKTIYTELGVLIGTPEYMSPEQAEMTGQNIDTRTDVYSLGVLLYELLTGALPFDSRELRAAGFDEIRRRIREINPPKPSTRFGSLPGERSTVSAHNRRSEPGTLTRQIRGDLDWITMKALEKDRTRRYGSASDLAMDLGRYLRDEPVLAGPPSGIYRAKKFVQRNKVGVGVAALVAVAMTAFTVTTTIQSGRIAREAETAEQVSNFLVELFEISDPSESRGNTITAREILDRGAEKIETELAGQPEVQGRLLHVMGRVFNKLSLYPSAEKHLLRAVEVHGRSLGKHHPETLGAKVDLGTTYWRQRRDAEAEAINEEVLEERRRTLGEDHVDTLSSYHSLALVYWIQGRLEDAERLHRIALEGRKRLLGDEHPDTLTSMNSLATVLWTQERYDEALPVYLDAFETRSRVFGDDHPNTLRVKLNIAEVYERQGRLDEAIRLAEETLASRRTVMGEAHQDTNTSRASLARMYRSTGRLQEAASLLAENLPAVREKMGDDHPETFAAAKNLARLYKELRRYEEAEAVLSEAIEAQRAAGPLPERALVPLAELGTILRRMGRLDEAEAALEEAIDRMRDVRGQGDDSVLTAQGDLASLYSDQGRYAESERLQRAVIESMRKNLGPRDTGTLIAMHNLGLLYQRQGLLEQAEPMIVDSVDGLRAELPERHPLIPLGEFNLGCFRALQGRPDEALEALRRAVEQGYAQPDALMESDELRSLQGRPELEAIVAAAAENARNVE